MNKKIVYTILLSSILILFTSCLNYDDLIPASYDKIVLLKEPGLKDVPLYNIGENGNYEFIVLKSGNKPSATAQAEIKVLSDAELALHSQKVGANYKLLPSTMYEINDRILNFSSEQQYLHRNIVFKTDLIKSLKESDDSDYVLPVQLVSATDSVNNEKNLLILRPSVVTPVVEYEFSYATLHVSGDKSTYELRLQLPFESIWDFDVTVKVDPSALPSGYSLISSKDYTLENDGKVEFKKGNYKSEPLKVVVNNKDIFSSLFVIPIKIVSVSLDGFDIPSNNFLLYVAYNKIALTLEMLSTNAQEPDEGPIANLIDGDPATYFHTAYSWNPGAPHYFQIKLPYPITMCQFFYQNRNNANGKPQDIKIWVSSNASTWTELTRINSGLPTDAGSTYKSPVLTATESFTHFRFEVQESNLNWDGTVSKFFGMAEFELYGK